MQDMAPRGEIRNQARSLEAENRRLRQTVQSLMKRIEDNQRIDDHFKDFEMKLLGRIRFGDLLDLLLLESREFFELADVSLVLIDRDFSIHRLLHSLKIGDYRKRLQLRNGDDFTLGLYAGKRLAQLGEQDALTAARLFPGLDQLGSAALLPLLRNNQLIGSLHFASRDRGRFTADKAPDFMQRMASVAAVCLENCLAHEHLRYQSRIDMLTGVNNRMNFEQEFAKELERSARSDDPLSCLFVDVDHFKKINDSHGHQFGDRCLREVAAAINRQLRKTDVLGRYGGEEFVVALHRCESTEAQLIAERIRSAVEALTIAATGELKVKLTVSIGLASWQPLGERSTQLSSLGQRLLRDADEALYEAKNAGRNRVVARPFVQ